MYNINKYNTFNKNVVQKNKIFDIYINFYTIVSFIL